MIKQQYVPEMDNPYKPESAGISDFEYKTDLVLRRAVNAVPMTGNREADYIVDEPYTVRFKVDGNDHSITVPSGMLTDLASVPWGFRVIIGRVGSHLEAAIVHDYLFIAWCDLGLEPTRDMWHYSNRVMVAGLKAADVPSWKCWVISWALSTPFSWWIFSNCDKSGHYITPT